MPEQLSREHRSQLEKWIGKNRCNFNLLYQITRDGCSNVTFHQKCDAKGPTVVVVFNTSGYIYGGYTSVPWSSDGIDKNDNNAFLFSLGAKGKSTNYGVINGSLAVFCHSSYGPYFGDSSSADLVVFSGTVTRSNNYFSLNSTSNFGGAYNSNGHTINDLTGGVNTVTELEVYQLEERKGEVDVWRKTPAWDKKLLGGLKSEVEGFCPLESLRLRYVQILLIGPVGSGKSSFFNTINSIFRGRVSSQAPTGSVEHSLTTQYRKYKVQIGEAGKPTRFRLCDTMGLEEGQGIDAADIPFILDGNLPDRYRFNPASHVNPDVAKFNKSPTLKDKIHCVAFVMDGTKVDILSEKVINKIQAIRHHINQRDIPIVILLTKIDKICPLVAENVSAVFRSAEVEDIVAKLSDLIGVPRSHVLPVKNYEAEIELDFNVDILALLSMRQMLWYANDFLHNEDDQDEDEEEYVEKNAKA